MKKTFSIILVLMLVCSLFAFPASASGAGDYGLTGTTVKLEESDVTVDIPFVSVAGGNYYSLEGDWSKSETESTNYLTLTALTAGGTASPTENSAETGRIVWMDMTFSAPITVDAGGAIWTATYTIDKDTPAGDYTVSFGVTAITDSTYASDTTVGTLTATITVTRDDSTPTTGYGVALSSDVTEVAKDGTVNLYLDVTNSGENTYNAFYATLTYDSTLVSYSGGNVSGYTVDVDSDTPGTLKISKVGEDVDIVGGHELTLPFTATAAGSASFALTGAKVDKADNAESDAPDATISGSPVAVTITETYTYSVSVTLGANMSSSGGELSQTGLTGAMTDVVVTPDTGYELTAPMITGSGVTATLNSETGAYTVSGTPTEDVTVTFADATEKAPTVEATTSTYFTGYTLIAATVDTDGYVPTYDGETMFTVEGYEDGTYYYVIFGTYDATKLGYATGTATNIAKSADVNQTGVIDINDAQFVYNIYNGTEPTTNVVQRLLLADVNRDKTVDVSDCAAVVAAIG